MSVEVSIDRMPGTRIFDPVRWFVRVTQNKDYSEFRYFWTLRGAKKYAATVKYPLAKEISK